MTRTALTSLVYFFAALALWTLLPLPPAARINDLGYHSACPFAPWSSLAMLLVAGLAWAVRQYLITRVD
jgi:hypothetical protein